MAAIGSPLGNENSLAVGVVSAVGRSIAALTAAQFQLIDAIQTDAPITHGSSGGPLLDAKGRVIGINAQIRSDSGGSSGIGFAVPIDSARRSLADLLAHGRVAYAYAGLQTQDMTPSLARHLQLAVLHGALVERVTPGGPAAQARASTAARARPSSRASRSSPAAMSIVSVNGMPVQDADSTRAHCHKQAPTRTDRRLRDRPGRRAPHGRRAARRAARRLVERPGPAGGRFRSWADGGSCSSSPTAGR